MANGWTEERKARQRSLIQDWKPWAKSSGPKSASGKRTVSQNSLKHGRRSRVLIAQRRQLRRQLRELNAALSRLEQLQGARRAAALASGRWQPPGSEEIELNNFLASVMPDVFILMAAEDACR